MPGRAESSGGITAEEELQGDTLQLSKRIRVKGRPHH
jgi:hypothetical protein